MIEFPTARPLVIDPKRTFLEKAASIHVFCRTGRWGSGEGDCNSRRWYDLDRLAQAGIALVHGLIVVTRNVKDFDGFGVEFFNPFKYQGP